MSSGLKIKLEADQSIKKLDKNNQIYYQSTKGLHIKWLTNNTFYDRIRIKVLPEMQCTDRCEQNHDYTEAYIGENGHSDIVDIDERKQVLPDVGQHAEKFIKALDLTNRIGKFYWSII